MKLKYSRYEIELNSTLSSENVILFKQFSSLKKINSKIVHA